MEEKKIACEYCGGLGHIKNTTCPVCKGEKWVVPTPAASTPAPANAAQMATPPFPDKMSFREMLTNLFNTDFLSGEELKIICDAGEMYANGCLKLAAPGDKGGEEAAEWVRVEDGLPDFGANVLVIIDGVVRLGKFTGAGWYLFETIGIYSMSGDQTATHWRPLPAPPNQTMNKL